MSTFSIPNSQGQIRQGNRGDTSGELWGTCNIDLTSSLGKIKSSKKLSRILSNADVGGNAIVALLVHNNYYYALTTEEMYNYSGLNPVTGTWNAVSGTDNTGSGMDNGVESDLVSFGGAILMSQGTDIARYIEGGSFQKTWWTTVASGTALTADVPHVMHVHRTGTDTLFITDGNKIRYYNGPAAGTIITLESLFTACCIDSGIDYVWVGTYNEVEDSAFVYQIRVGDDAPLQAYRVEGRAVLSITVIDDVPYIVTERGNIQAFNGAGFTTVANFPFSYDHVSLSGVTAGSISDDSIQRPIHPKGMRSYNKTLLININTLNQESTANNVVVNERSPSGIWEYDTETRSLNHKHLLNESSTEVGSHTLLRTSPILVTAIQETQLLVAGNVTGGGVGLWGESDDTQQSYFITPEIVSNTITEAWEKVVLKADTLPTGAEITIKYRTSKNPAYPYYGDVTWLNATQFNTTDTTIGAAADGEEIEIMSGSYAGQSMHITAITGTTTFTVTVDKSIGTLNDTSKVRLSEWKLLANPYTPADGEFKVIGGAGNNPWYQFKVFMVGEVTIRQVISKGNSKTEL